MNATTTTRPPAIDHYEEFAREFAQVPQTALDAEEAKYAARQAVKAKRTRRDAIRAVTPHT